MYKNGFHMMLFGNTDRNEMLGVLIVGGGGDSVVGRWFFSGVG